MTTRATGALIIILPWGTILLRSLVGRLSVERREAVKKIFNQTWVYLVAALVIFLDQYTKHLVRQYLDLNGVWYPFTWTEAVRVLYINNTGAAFGIFKAAGSVFTLIAIVVSAVIIYYAYRLPPGHWWMRLALGLQLGGALGNLIDRLMFGTVTDFISIFTFAIFNVADASISVGVAMLAIIMWIESRQEKKKKLAAASPPADSLDVGEAS